MRMYCIESQFEGLMLTSNSRFFKQTLMCLVDEAYMNDEEIKDGKLVTVKNTLPGNVTSTFSKILDKVDKGETAEFESYKIYTKNFQEGLL